MGRTLAGIPFREVWGFLLVGVMGIIADIGTFSLLAWLGMAPLIASLIGFSLGIVVSFLGNKVLTFRHREVRHLGRAWGTFIAINLLALGFIQLTVWIGTVADIDLLALNVLRTAAIGIATAGRFVAYRRWVFVAPAAAGQG